MPTDMYNPTSERNGLIGLTGTLLLACGIWYFGWVQPHNEFLNATLDCTGSHLTQVSWDKCAAKVAKAPR